MSLPSLDTERFHLRPLVESDAGLYVAIHTDPLLMRHVAEPLTETAARRTFEKVERFNRSGHADYRTWVIVERAARQEIGLLALVARAGMSEIGALILPAWHGDGVATEIIRRLVDFAFTECGVGTVFTRHRAENGLAEGLMRKLDFERIPAEGHRDGGVRWERTLAHWQNAARHGAEAVAASPQAD